MKQVEMIEEYFHDENIGGDYKWNDNHGFLVRCKDCIYWQDNNGGYPHEECRWGHDETPNEDDYCSYGVRKDG